MKTQFHSILQIKKQELEREEAKIASINQMIVAKMSEIAQFQAQMQEILLPSSGTLHDFRILQENRQAFLFQIDSMHLEISELKQERKQKEESYKQAYIEYEKINYLHTTELKKHLSKLKKAEEKTTDEIATTLFSLKERP